MVDAAAARTADFSTARSPGVVLRVQVTRAGVCATASAIGAVRGRDPAEVAEEVQRDPLGGEQPAGGSATAATTSPGATRARPDAGPCSSGSPSSATPGGRGRSPATTPGSRATRRHGAAGSAGPRRVGGEVAGVAEVLGRAARTSGSSRASGRRVMRSGMGGEVLAVSRARPAERVGWLRGAGRDPLAGVSVRVCAPRLSVRQQRGDGDHRRDQDGVACGRSRTQPRERRRRPRRRPRRRAARRPRAATMRRSPAAGCRCSSARCRPATRRQFGAGGRAVAGDACGRPSAPQTTASSSELRRQPVRAVQPGRGDLAAGPQARRRRCARAGRPRHRPCGSARRGGPGRGRVAGSRPAARHARGDGGERRGEPARRAPRGRRGTPGAPGAQRRVDRAGDHVTRRERVAPGRRTPPALTSRAPAPRTASLTSGIGSRPTSSAVGCSWTISTSRTRRAGPQRERQPLPARPERVGRAAVQAADAAGGEDHAAGRELGDDAVPLDQHAAHGAGAVVVGDGRAAPGCGRGP